MEEVGGGDALAACRIGEAEGQRAGGGRGRRHRHPQPAPALVVEQDGDAVRLLADIADRAQLGPVRALDRVLTWNHYLVPHWHLSKFRVAYKDKFSRPALRPKYSLGQDAWWEDSRKEAALPRLR